MSIASASPLPASGLCICADDFAASAAISEAIVALLAGGQIQATSAMVLSPRWAQDAPALQAVAQGRSVGLHLDWTSAFAVQAGHGTSLGWLMAQTALRALSPSRTREVIERQLDAFESVWGQAPAHVDGHQHVHQFPVIREALVQALRDRYGDRAPWLRVSQVWRPATAGWGLAALKAGLITAWGSQALADLAAAQGWAVRQPLLGVYDFRADAARHARLCAQWRQHAPDGAVLMVHPATAADPDDAIGPARLMEWQYWSGPSGRG